MQRVRSALIQLQWINILGILYKILVFLIKLSILLQYLRVFVPNRKGNMRLFVAIQIVIWSSFLFYFADTVFAISLCSPQERVWNKLITTGHCFD